MIRLTLVAIAAIAALSVRAQIPQKFNYQAIVRGNAGMVIAMPERTHPVHRVFINLPQ